ncbi:MAG: hypothetical protein KF847_05005 [Pirellulales bacterium]|nr:hypothetical protein [Pirellulales bacterium]
MPLRAALVVAAWLALWGRAAPAPAAGVAGMLLLTNGNLVEGVIVRSGDYYRVIHEEIELRVPAVQVDAYCRTLDEAYAIRRGRFRADGPGQLELARWCLRNNLVEQAARELLDARTHDPSLPEIAAVERQLMWALRPNAGGKTKPPAAVPRQGVVQASWNEPDSAQSSPALATPSHGIDPSDAARAQFVRSIQPMLIHSCANAGCHQRENRSPLALDRMVLAGGGNRAAVERNLASVLTLVDRTHPDDSRLIALARQAHGDPGAESSPLTSRQTALLIGWVRDAVGYVPPPPEAESTPEGFEEFAPEWSPEKLAGLPRAPRDKPVASGVRSGDSPATISASAAPTGFASGSGEPTKPAAVPRRLAVPDPFDPAEFHRRIAARQAARPVADTAAPSGELKASGVSQVEADEADAPTPSIP